MTPGASVGPQCTRALYPIDGFATPSGARPQVIEFKVPDMFDRPWAKIWEENFEQDMDRPKTKRSTSASSQDEFPRAQED